MKAKNVKVLIIMDGFGIPLDQKRSAIKESNTKFITELKNKYTSGKLNASEEYVGLPMGQTGTSDVGHLTIGTGRVIYQPLVRINRDIKSGEFDKNTAILAAINNAKNNDKALHLLGIPTTGGVHGHIDHLLKLIELCAKHKLKKVYIHYFTDGRDTPPKSALEFYDIIQQKIDEQQCGEIVSVVGRFYALDRDKNWDRVEKAYNMMVNGEGKKSNDLRKSILEAYDNGETDEFISPVIKIKNNSPVAKIEKGDSVIIYNYRADRERQLAYVLSDSCTLPYAKKLNLTLVCMTEYDESLKGVLVAYPTLKHKNILSEVLSDRGYTQLKVAETEKYAYITFAFNAGRNDAFKNEDRKLVASEKMKLYSGKPEMSADIVIDGIESKKYDCIILNFANPDMVGHSGDKKAAEIAIQVVNDCVKDVVEHTLNVGGEILITADHGNADIMLYEDGTPHTSHTINLVPVILVGKRFENGRKDLSGSLPDIAPTYLKMLGEKIPEDMTGKPLF